MKRPNQFLTLIGIIALTCLANVASAQGQSPARGGSSPGNSEAARARAQSQLQQRVQQRVQENIQNRARGDAQAKVREEVQARVQAKLQERFKDRVQVDVQSAVRTAERAVDAAERRAEGFRGKPNTASLPAGGDSESGTRNKPSNGNASKATRAAIAEQYGEYGTDFTYADLDEETRAKLPPGFARADEQALMAVFGNLEALPASDSVQTDAAPRVDVQQRIQAATRNRRAQISKMRDKALATGNVALLEQADRAELMLDAFVEVQQERLSMRKQPVTNVATSPASTTNQ